MTHQEFERLVEQTLSELPADLHRHIANVAFVVEELADDETLDLADVDDPYDLFGFYHGIPLTERTHDYGLVLPDKISIYRQPILREGRTDSEISELIRRTVRHEIAHYFGIDDERLEELGAY
ncbi:MAG: metallopeptidase family protein [Anaerolineales bacterium]|nr:metallopeptidase family protein [Anaerolineales bacterium]